MQSVYASNASFFSSPPNLSGSISVHAADPVGTQNEAPLALITGTKTDLGYSYGLALDASGRIYVCANTSSLTGPSSAIFMYAAHPHGTLNEAPLATIAGTNTGLSAGPYQSCSIALDASGMIYAVGTFITDSTRAYNSINVYPANPSGTLNEAPSAMIVGSKTGLHLPNGVTLDANGKIYVTNDNPDSITVYAANPSGVINEAPLATIAGSNTGLDDPSGIALDAAGRIYVVNDNPLGNAPAPSITVYPANPSGTLNEAPIATITGSATTLTHGACNSIALDAAGRIYVANASSITVFAANPTGTRNEAPIGAISGSNTDLGAPVGIAIR